MKRSEMVQNLIRYVYDATDGGYYMNEQDSSLLLKFIEKAGMLPPDSYYDEDQGIVPMWELENYEIEAIEKERREFFENLPRNLPTFRINRFTGEQYQSIRHKYAEAWNEGLTLQEIADKFNVTTYRVEMFLRLVERQMREDGNGAR